MPKDFGINKSFAHFSDTIYSDSFWPLRQAVIELLSFYPFSFKKLFFMVYLIHFQMKLHHAQHYIGYVGSDLIQRIGLHRAGCGAKLLAALNNNGINWQVVRLWLNGDRALERKLKNYKKSRCFCPVCGGKA